MATKTAYKITGLVFLTVGVLFFLRDIGINYIGNTDLLNVILVLVGAGLLAGGGEFEKPAAKKSINRT